MVLKAACCAAELQSVRCTRAADSRKLSVGPPETGLGWWAAAHPAAAVPQPLAFGLCAQGSTRGRQWSFRGARASGAVQRPLVHTAWGVPVASVVRVSRGPPGQVLGPGRPETACVSLVLGGRSVIPGFPWGTRRPAWAAWGLAPGRPRPHLGLFKLLRAWMKAVARRSWKGSSLWEEGWLWGLQGGSLCRHGCLGRAGCTSAAGQWSQAGQGLQAGRVSVVSGGSSLQAGRGSQAQGRT